MVVCERVPGLSFFPIIYESIALGYWDVSKLIKISLPIKLRPLRLGTLFPLVSLTEPAN